MPPTSPTSNIASLFQQLSAAPDQAALWQLHMHYYHRLYAYVLPFVQLKEAAEEITNDVFLEIWQRRRLLNKVIQPELYLFVCAKNKALHYLKKRSLPFESLDHIRDTECVLEMDPYEQLISSEMLKQINQAIAALPPKCRMIFRMVKENNLKYREVAELLDISEKTVENQMSIALRKLTASIQFRMA
jgi:RNA polymerase sigma-70 factor, Bacteroides expansion family 1